MGIISKILIVIIALEHAYFLYLEMFAWETLGKKSFKNIPEHLFIPTKKLAANQGLYNGFLAAGLVWALCISDYKWQFYISIFFLTCISIAGIYGGLSASKKIFFIQAIPALLTLILLHLKF